MVLRYLKENGFNIDEMNNEDIELVEKTVHYNLWKVKEVLKCESKRIKNDFKRIWKIDRE